MTAATISPPKSALGKLMAGSRVSSATLTENLEPKHLMQWTRLAYGVDAEFGDFEDLQPWSATPEPAPVARPQETSIDRDELRRAILDELRELVRSG
jgi:acetaldehyde dehydrogenase / alcohol dehydrogenase